MIYQLPLPLNGEIFENLMCDLINHMFNTTSFDLYGRKGQAQHGIDIISYEFDVVIQCKFRNTNFENKKFRRDLANEIISDIHKILIKMKHPPKKLIIATTLQNDTELQDYLNCLLIFNKLGSFVEFWGWNKISNELFLFNNLIEKYFSFRRSNIELANMKILNKSVYQKNKMNYHRYDFKNVKKLNQLPIFDFSFLNNTSDTILLNSIECFSKLQAIAKCGNYPECSGLLKPTKKILVDLKFDNFLESYTFLLVELDDPIFIYPQSPFRIQIQNKKPLNNFCQIYFKFNFNKVTITSPEIFFNGDNPHSGKLISRI
ncbi:hypothetical protein IAE19_09850 [Acinetobacter sp. S40]|uniref:hypothetical protein n=1 Tax=Acinetobacter sp. S40 TaxID=2767434 RepID=UPI00190A1080|nr:hypothetical protein [Acinetobacter sp. S40]MBJ9985744.1 hypothetical protein [Acinetobacter sp. S40]